MASRRGYRLPDRSAETVMRVLSGSERRHIGSAVAEGMNESVPDVQHVEQFWLDHLQAVDDGLLGAEQLGRAVAQDEGPWAVPQRDGPVEDLDLERVAGVAPALSGALKDDCVLLGARW